MPLWERLPVLKIPLRPSDADVLEGDELNLCEVASTNSDKPTLRPSEFNASKNGYACLVLKKLGK